MSLNCLTITISENGNLDITATPDGVEFLNECVESNEKEVRWINNQMSIWSDLLESYSCNGSYTLLPSSIFALVDDNLPIIAHYDDIEHYGENDNGETGTIKSVDKCWAYIDYAITDELSELLHGKTVTFYKV